MPRRFISSLSDGENIEEVFLLRSAGQQQPCTLIEPGQNRVINADECYRRVGAHVNRTVHVSKAAYQGALQMIVSHVHRSRWNGRIRPISWSITSDLGH